MAEGGNKGPLGPEIIVEDVTARFGDHVLFEKVSFQVRRGEIFVIAGESGCGKSTLLKIMIGLLRPHRGKVWVDGIEITNADEEEMRRIRKKAGVLFQFGALLGSMTILENIALPLREYTDLTPDLIERVVHAKLAMVNLLGYEDHLPSELSGGMKKRAGLARAMALDPEVLFFDEPFSGLDPATSTDLEILIRRIASGMGSTMVMVSHDLPSIFNLADRMILLDGSGRGIIAQGDPRDLRDRADEERVVRFLRRQGPEEPGKGKSQ